MAPYLLAPYLTMGCGVGAVSQPISWWSNERANAYGSLGLLPPSTHWPSGLTCRPRLLPLPASEQSVAETLQAMEVKWVASMQASSRGTARLSSETSDSLPAWMTPSQTSRMHWSDRQQQRQEQHQQQTQLTGIRINAGLSLPSPTACVAGTLGVSKAPQLLRGV